MKTIEFNPLGESQREQWHTVVNLLRVLGGDLDSKGRSDLCDELDRYIDSCENVFDDIRAEEKQRDERFPAGYAEIEYTDMDSEEAVRGCAFDDMNYLRYRER